MSTKTLDFDKIMELHQQGKSQNEIVAATGLSKLVVNTTIRNTIHLLEQQSTSQAPGQVRIVPFDQVHPNPWQPRKTMDPLALARLADDIAEQGLLQTPRGRPAPVQGEGAVQLAFGHRRLAAVKLLVERGQWVLEGLPVALEDMSDVRMFLIALSENSQRDNPDPLDELEAIQHSLETIEGLTITQVASNKGLDRSTLSNHLRCLKLPDVVLDPVHQGEMTLSGAREFLCLQNEDHSHVDQMALVIRDIRNTSGRPDFRPSNVRRVIASLVWRQEASWRPLEPRQGQDRAYIAQEGRAPSFEVQPFMMQHPHLVHHLPAGEGSNTRAWTCDVRQWQRLQTAATREINKAQAESGAAPAPEQRESPDQRWIAAMKQDPAVVAALGGQTPSNDTLRKMATETAEKLGTLATRVSNSDRFNLGLHLMPVYLDNPGECAQECTTGAKLALRNAWEVGEPVYKCCTNQQCFNRKSAAGKAVFVETLLQQRQAQEARARKLIDAEEPVLTDAVASQILSLAQSSIPGGVHARRPNTRDRQTDQELAWWPDYLLSAARMLGVAPRKITNWNPNEVISVAELVAADKSPAQLRHLAAVLLVYLSEADIKEESHA